MSLYYLEYNSLRQSGEAHECHRQDAGGDEGDWNAFHAFGNVGEFELFAETGEDCEGETVADCICKGINGGFGRTVGRLARYLDCNAKYCTVGCNQRQKDAQRLIQRGRHLLQYEFNDLHQRCNHEDERNGLHKFYAKGDEEFLDVKRYERCNHHHKRHSARHADGGALDDYAK